MRKADKPTSICEICKYYNGGIPVNVNNFKCSLGVSSLKVIICNEREATIHKEWKEKYCG